MIKFIRFLVVCLVIMTPLKVVKGDTTELTNQIPPQIQDWEVDSQANDIYPGKYVTIKENKIIFSGGLEIDVVPYDGKFGDAALFKVVGMSGKGFAAQGPFCQNTETFLAIKSDYDSTIKAHSVTFTNFDTNAPPQFKNDDSYYDGCFAFSYSHVDKQ